MKEIVILLIVICSMSYAQDVTILDYEEWIPEDELENLESNNIPKHFSCIVCSWESLQLTDLLENDSIRFVKLSLKVNIKTKMKLKNKLKNISLINNNDEVIHPIAISLKTVLNEPENQISFLSSDMFVLGAYTLFEEDNQFDLIIAFDEINDGDILVIDHLLKVSLDFNS